MVTAARSSAARYTSPALSRALRDAGVSQTGERFWYYDHQVSTDPFLSQHAIPSGPDRVRALRLDEILEELEAANPSGEWTLTRRAEGYLAQTYTDTHERSSFTESRVEAAGYLLLAVRKAKREG